MGQSKIVRQAIMALVVLFLGGLIVQFALANPTVGASGNLVDFDAFYIVGQLVTEGRAAEAYDPALMSAIQQQWLDHDGFMPWTYPPPFDLLTAALPLLPRGLSYALFIGLTLAVYLALLARLAGSSMMELLIALLPTLFVAIASGQNSFLTGALMAGCALLTLANRAEEGLPLGLLVIKPHLGIGLGLHALFTRRWGALGIALGVALVLSAAATLVMGPGIWPAFRGAIRAAGELLAVDFYPIFRMPSVYALLFSLGLPAGAALVGQGLAALLASAAVAFAVLRHLPPRWSLAVACFSSALMSPYFYDYDMTIVGVGVALIVGDLLARSTLGERRLLLVLGWTAGGWGLACEIATNGLDWEARTALTQALPSMGAVAYLLLLALIARILSRPAAA